MVPFHQDKTVFLELPVVGGINGLPFSVTPQESKTFILRGYAFEGCAPVFEHFFHRSTNAIIHIFPVVLHVKDPLC